MLKVTCKGCGANYEVPDDFDFAGSKIRCKTCSEVMPIIGRIKKGDIERAEKPPKVSRRPEQESKKIAGCVAGAAAGGLVILLLAGALLILVVGLLIGTCV